MPTIGINTGQKSPKIQTFFFVQQKHPNLFLTMFKLVLIVCLAVASVSAKPGLLSAPLVAAAPAVVTAHSSQVVARSYNGLAAPLIAAPVLAHSAPVVAAHSAPLLAAHGIAAPLAYSSPLLPYSAYSPYAAAAHAVYV